jgi:hypothetical protein
MLLEPGEREQVADRLRAHGRAASFDLIAEGEESGGVVGGCRWRWHRFAVPSTPATW